MKPVTTKPHYLLLDALRGIAAIIVLWYHTFEGFATSVTDQECNHGYLAVDFFFLLSGFVIVYAYEDRLTAGQKSNRMSITTFLKRRLIRLHPMVVLGVIIGLVTFLIQGGTQWDFDGNGNPVHVAMCWIMVAVLFNLFLLPNIPNQPCDVRGNGELFPLNGPHWSLFFEYIGNLLYGLMLHRFKTWMLGIICLITGGCVAYITLTNGYLGVGWTLTDFWSGLVRMLFPYTSGMLLARMYTHKRESALLSLFIRKHAFLISTLLLLILLPMPFVGNEETLWMNGIYVMFIIIAIFPFILWIAASGSELLQEKHNIMTRCSNVLGLISYPLYAIHYPIMYLFYNYIGFPHVNKSFADVWPIAIGCILLNITLAIIALKYFDQPIRRWLTKSYLK